MKKLLLIGGGGHCRSVLDAAIGARTFAQIGIIDRIDSLCYKGITVVGKDEDLVRLFAEGWTDAFISLGSIGDTGLRQRLYKKISEIGFNIPNIIDPSAVVSADIQLGDGIFVGKSAVINAGSTVDSCAIVNTAAVVEHDCHIGSFAHISPGSVLCGQVTVGNAAHIGAGAVVIQQIEIGEKALIGAGSVVVKDIPDEVRAYGNPCKVIE